MITSITLILGQTTEELVLLKENCCSHNHSDQNYKLSDAHGGIVNSLFILYKVFLSSQDHQSCVFTPSCSEYAVQSIKKQGFTKGMLDTFDRLTRCHGFGKENYLVDPITKLLVDPVRDINYVKL